jgi:phosphoribosylamine--glycine ligase
MPERDFKQLLPTVDQARPAATVVMATQGYPGHYHKGSVISNVKEAGEIEGVTIFHAGTGTNEAGELVANGGRVLNVTAVGDDLKQAVERCYKAVDTINWPEGVCRRDIAWRALARE